MAITSLRLDGQNLGFQTTGADPISVLSLNISTGALASAYLTDADLRGLAPAVSELFALVPSASRAANALGMLQKLAVVSSAGSATVALSATNVGSVYTLVATPSGASFLVAHLPYSAGEGLGWASAGGGSSLATPVSLANGGTSTDLSGSAANQGAFFYGGAAGSGSLAPMPIIESPIATNPGVPSVAKNATIRVNGAVKNGSVFFDQPSTIIVFGQAFPTGGAVGLGDLVLTLVTGGFLQPLPDFATSGRFVAGTTGPGPNSGKIEFTVGTTNVNPAGVAGNVFIGLGPGAGSQVMAGANVNLTFT